jgi:hypothetical protein
VKGTNHCKREENQNGEGIKTETRRTELSRQEKRTAEDRM